MSVRPQFDRDSTIEPWTSAFTGSMTGSNFKTLVVTHFPSHGVLSSEPPPVSNPSSTWSSSPSTTPSPFPPESTVLPRSLASKTSLDHRPKSMLLHYWTSPTMSLSLASLNPLCLLRISRWPPCRHMYFLSFLATVAPLLCLEVNRYSIDLKDDPDEKLEEEEWKMEEEESIWIGEEFIVVCCKN